jgi:cell division protein FtsL
VLLIGVLLTAVYLHWDYKTNRVEQMLINARLNVENRELAAKDLQLQEDIIKLNSLIDDQNNKILELKLELSKKK